MPADLMITHESDLAKLEEQRVQGLETQGTAILTVVLAIAAFTASTVDRQTLQDNPVLIGVAVFFMLGAAGFAIAARGPRALKARFWTVVKPAYGPLLEERLAQADNAISHAQTDDTPAILESWRARRALSAYFAEAKALWVTCSLICLLLAFVSVGVAGLLLVV
jgi:hypothetical protein